MCLAAHNCTDFDATAMAGLVDRLTDPSDLGNMPIQDRRDPFDSRRAPMTSWERSLRPVKTSGWLTGCLMVVGILFIVWVATKPTMFQKAARKQDTANVVPAITPAIPSRQIDPVVAPQPALQAQRITKCIGTQGTAGYTDGACPVGSRSVDAELPAITIADGMMQDQRLASQQVNRIEAQRVLAHELQVAQNVDRTSDECGMLNGAIAAYDTEARQPLPAWRQDRLRELRKATRDRQFSLRCQ